MNFKDIYSNIVLMKFLIIIGISIFVFNGLYSYSNQLLYFKIDSLLKDDTLKIYSSTIKTIYPETNKSLFPSAELYNNLWNITKPNPYEESLLDEDSILKLVLVNDTNDFYFPGDGSVTSGYGWRYDHFHQGIDLDIYHGLPVYAAFSGVVRFSRSFGNYGRLVIIRHDNGLETFYGHLGRIMVKAGTRVNAGDQIGTCGNSGSSRGTHLHFEVRFRGVSINPAHFINFDERKLKYADIILKRQSDKLFVYNENAILYKVKRGDYLYRIAEEFGISVKKLKTDNDLLRKPHIRVGQILSIYL